MKKRAYCIVSGHVQGVCFRMCAMDEAKRLGLTGWIGNRRDGSVEAIAEGEESALCEFADWCRKGPDMAVVSGVDTSYSEATGEFHSFAIRHG